MPNLIIKILIKTIIILILIFGVIFVVSSGEFSFAKSKIVSILFKKDCSNLAPKNPYPQATSEYAGFNWSKIDRGSRDCEAYNKTFTTGCVEYIQQEISYNECLDNKSEIKKYEAVKPILLVCKKGEDIDGYCFSDWGNNSIEVSLR